MRARVFAFLLLTVTYPANAGEESKGAPPDEEESICQQAKKASQADADRQMQFELINLYCRDSDAAEPAPDQIKDDGNK